MMSPPKRIWMFSANQRFIEILKARGIEFIVVGGTAVSYYSDTTLRHPKDLDVLLNPTTANAVKVYQFLGEFNLTPHFEERQLTYPKTQLHIDHPKEGYLVDLLTPDPNQDFSQLMQRASTAIVGNTIVKVISRDDLIASKQHFSLSENDPQEREKHLGDLELLKAL